MVDRTPSPARVRNRRTWRDTLARLRGSPTVVELRRYDGSMREITRLGPEVRRLSDTQLTARARALRASVEAGTSLRDVRGPLFALAREAAARAIGQRPFDEQLVAALALDEGAIVEMQTGEGKTLAGVILAAHRALAGLGVHVLTFNDYLARRDAEWMAPVYDLLGTSVGCIRQGMDADQRRAAYAADVTYVTATEAGFDYLRDGLALTVAQRVQRQRYSALVDEADSLLIDEARVPLVLAGARAADVIAWPELTALVGSLTPGVHFDTDEYARNVELIDAGLDRVEQALGCGSLHDEANHVRLTRLNCALHARTLLHRDVDYLVRDGRIELVDDDTGRVMHDRRWPDGLQAALEAKEGLLPRDQGMPLASITLQRFFAGYERLSGMTGTARAASDELWETYGTAVVVVPTHRPLVRHDRPDVVFTHREAKEHAIVEEVRVAHRSGRPVLVGTRTVADSERLAARLTSVGIPCTVLNARDDSREAEIVAAAGTVGAVTISTNMAGRGTDIRLGGADGKTRAQVVALGGLYVIGTSRHESRRVDLQLRGRAGRQGDPGETRFLLSLDDDLLVRFGIDGLIPAACRPARQDTPVDHPVVRREVARAQRIAEGQDREIRRTLARYTAVVDDQYAAFRARRQAVLHENAPDRDALLGRLDGRWSEHLALCEDLREGVHLVRLGGRDPLAHYAAAVTAAFDFDEATRIDGDVLRPTSTWTYLVNDDPFRAQVALTLLGPGGVTLAIYAGALLTPLLLLWGSVERWGRRRVARRTPPRE